MGIIEKLKGEFKGKLAIVAPTEGEIVDVKVHTGSSVKKGDILFTLDAMKFIMEVTAPKSGSIQDVCFNAGDTISMNDKFCDLIGNII